MGRVSTRAETRIGPGGAAAPAEVFNLPFVLFYGLAASVMVRRIWGRYPPGEGWMVEVAKQA